MDKIEKLDDNINYVRSSGMHALYFPANASVC